MPPSCSVSQEKKQNKQGAIFQSFGIVPLFTNSKCLVLYFQCRFSNPHFGRTIPICYLLQIVITKKVPEKRRKHFEEIFFTKLSPQKVQKQRYAHMRYGSPQERFKEIFKIARDFTIGPSETRYYANVSPQMRNLVQYFQLSLIFFYLSAGSCFCKIGRANTPLRYLPNNASLI